MTTPHEFSEFLDEIKDSLTDQQYKTGMDLCKKHYDNQQNLVLYDITYLRPSMRVSFDDDGDPLVGVVMNKTNGLFFMTTEYADEIRGENKIRVYDEDCTIDPAELFDDDMFDDLVTHCNMAILEVPVLEIKKYEKSAAQAVPVIVID